MQIIRDKTIPIINNRNNFLVKDIPNYHPSSIKFLKFWKQEKKRCIEGYWGIDDAEINCTPLDEPQDSFKWRYMPGKLYFYVNYGTIKHRPDYLPKTAPKIKMRPYLRDLEWAYYYVEIEARGFSGFSEEKELSSNKALLNEDYTDEDLIHMCKDEEGKIIELKYNNLFKEDGSRKEYIEPREYIRRIFDKPMGLPIYENEASNFMLLGCHAENEKIVTPNGLKNVQDLKLGDKVSSPDGLQVRNITKLYSGNGALFKIKSKYRDDYIVTHGHTLHLYQYDKRGNNKKEVFKLLEELDFNKYKYEHIKTPVIHMNDKFHKLDPYFIGLWLGDGFKREKLICVSQQDKEILEWLKEYADSEDRFSYTITKSNGGVGEWTYRFRLIDNTLLTKNNWWSKTFKNNKHIPDEYKYCCSSKRRQLLAGLIDSDGWAEKSRYRIKMTNLNLLKDIKEVSESLGLISKINKNKPGGFNNSDSWTLTITGNIESIPCKLPRKKVKNSNLGKGHNRDYISVEEIGLGKFYGFDVDGDHLYTIGNYISTHNARGGGKSFLTANTIAHEWLFDGAKYYNENSIKNPAVVEVLVGAAISSKSSEILGKVADMLEEIPGIYDKDHVHPFYKEHSGTLKPNNFKNPFRHEYEKKLAGKWRKLGSKSKIYHATFTIENPEAAAGTRPGIIIVEEVGLCPNILTVHGSNEAAQMTDGVVKFGTSIYIGTGGNVEKIIESELIFRDPKGFSMLAFDDIWEGNGKIGWFVPAYYMDGNYKDENGNTMLEEAIRVYEKRREQKKKAKSSSAIDLEMMNYPLKPSEMFINKLGNKFPIAELKEQLIEVQSNKAEYEDKHWIGDLVYKSDGTLKFEPKEASEVVRDYPVLDNKNKPGCIEIFEMPKRNQDNEIFPNRYYLGTDTYDDDDSTTNSLGCVLVMDGWTKRIVAEYTGRRSTKEFYEITRKLTLFYNGINNYENNKKGLFWHYEKKKSLNLLAETPESLRDEANISIRRSGNTKYGTPATTGVNIYAIQCIEMWLDEQAAGREEGVTNVLTLRSPGIIKELISYNPDPDYNFDRISALGMLLILVEDRYKIINSEKSSSGIKRKDHSKDSFFTKNYKGGITQNQINNMRIQKRNNRIKFNNSY